MIRAPSTVAFVLLSAVVVGPALTVGQPSAPAPVTGEWLLIESVGEYQRAPVHTDPIEAEVIAGRWTPPQAGDTVLASDGRARTWTAAQPADDGWLRHEALNGGYACWTVALDQPGTMILDAAGHGLVYVNGEIGAGDTYSTGWVQLPVVLRAGKNTFLFAVGRGQVRASLTTPKADALFSPRDTTLPDLIQGETDRFTGALPVLNLTDAPLANLAIESAYAGAAPVLTPLEVIAPLTVRKAGFRIAAPAAGQTGDVEVALKLIRDAAGQATVLDTAQLKLSVRDPGDRHKRTFISGIDGSVQYYGVTPAHPQAGADADQPLALVLALHGASVEAAGLMGAYAHKSWVHVVVPTNRRPFGFDWEDWGGLDTLEVLALARQRWRIDPQRIYLTGHSMGGHGTWHVGATFPDRFAAIAPSAGWPDFWLYVGAASYENPTPIEKILDRAASPSRTMKLARNYQHYGVYILHGDRDEDVPVELARLMRKTLAEFHADFAYYERPGAPHWWGSECVDWPPLLEFLKTHSNPPVETVRHVEFHTASPGVSPSCDWVTIEAQTRSLEPSSVDINFDPQARKFSGKTENVARLSLDLAELSKPRQGVLDGQPVDATVLPADRPLTVELDGQAVEAIPWPAEPRIWLGREGQAWKVTERPSLDLKGPHRYGPFKEAFRNHFALVYGTKGTPAENTAAYHKARYDAETFWYRGNGTADVVSDAEFAAGDPTIHPR